MLRSISGVPESRSTPPPLRGSPSKPKRGYKRSRSSLERWWDQQPKSRPEGQQARLCHKASGERPPKPPAGLKFPPQGPSPGHVAGLPQHCQGEEKEFGGGDKKADQVDHLALTGETARQGIGSHEGSEGGQTNISELEEDPPQVTQLAWKGRGSEE